MSGKNALHIIDGHNEFNAGTNAKLNEWGILTKEFDYHLVAILGCQSSGKSTLLNALFDTSFDVMEAELGRTQTTVGIWMGNTPRTNVLVMDVEGTDSRERGEEALNIERKTSLFSLATVQVLMINVWTADIGRWQGSNLALLKIIFELNLQLFQQAKKGKTLLIFVLRDFSGQTPLEKLVNTVKADMDKIWETISKPADYVSSRVTDFFDFDFYPLPHKIFQPEAFEQKTAELKKRFHDPSDPNYIWKKYDFQTDIPADGWPQYASSVWQTIKENKDLDLPSQKEMLATYRCEEISTGVYQNFSKELLPLKQRLEKETAHDFGVVAEALVQKTMHTYDIPANRYHKETAQKKRESLLLNVLKDLSELFQKNIASLSDENISHFNADIKAKLGGDTVVSDFAQFARTMHLKYVDGFHKEAAKQIIAEAKEIWSFTGQFNVLKKRIEEKLESEREKQLALLDEEIKKILKVDLLNPVNEMLEKGDYDMWPKVRKLYLSGQEKTREHLLEAYKGFEPTKEQEEQKIDEVKRLSFVLLKEKLVDKSKFLPSKLKERFDSKFRVDADGLPRQWTPREDVKSLFKESLGHAIEIIDLYAIIRLDSSLDSVKYVDNPAPEPVKDDLIILNPDQCGVVSSSFRRECDAAYIQALREQEQYGAAQGLPVFIIGLIVILGFDEFLWLLTNPTLMIILTFISILVGVGYYLKLDQVLFPVLKPVLRTLGEQAHGQVMDGLKAKYQSVLGGAGGAEKPKLE